MADLTKTIELIFAGVNNTSSSIKDIGNDLGKLESSVGDLTGPLASLSKGILTAEASVLTIGAAMAGVAINEAGQFQESVTEIGTLFNGTSDQVAQLSQEILDYARNSTSSIEQINAAVYQAISTGTEWSEAIKLVAEADKLATAGNAELEAVTRLLTSALNAYGESTLRAGDYSNILFTAVQKGQTTIPLLADSLGQVTGLAAAAEVPFDALVAALSALTIQYGSTSESTTKLKALLTELLKPSDALQAALSGVTLAGDGLDGVMERLQVVTGGSAQEMTNLFGSTEAVQGALTLANDRSGKFAETLEAMANRTGVVSAAYEEMVIQFSNVNQKLLNNITATLTEFGGPLLDGYKDIAEQLGKIFENVSPSVNKDAFKPLYDAFDEASGELTEFLKGVAEALPAALKGVDFTEFLEAFQKLRGSVADIFDGLDLTKPEDLTKAIQFVVSGIEKLTLASASIVDGLGPFIQKIGELLDSVIKSDGTWIEFTGTLLGVATGINSTVVPAIGIAGDALSGIANLVLTIAGAKYLGASTTAFKTFGAAILGIGTTTIPTLVAAMNAPTLGLLAVAGATTLVIGDFAKNVIDLSGQMDANKQSLDNWNQAFAETDTWEGAIVRAHELGESVSDLNDEFIKAFGVSADSVAHYGSVEAALKAIEEASKPTAYAINRMIDDLVKSGATAVKTAEDYDKIVLSAYEQVRVNELHSESISALAAEYAAMSTAQQATLTDGEKAIFQAAQWAQANGEISGTTEEVVAAFKENQKSTAALAEEYRNMDLAQIAALSTEEKALYVKALTEEANRDAAAATKELTKAEVEAKLTAEQLSNARLKELEILSDTQVALEELASNERIKAMEFAFELDLEQLKGDIEIAKEVVGGLSETINGTAELLSDLFGYFIDADSGREKWAIEEQIDLENKRREQQLELQKRLTAALIEQMEARTKALEKGDGLITIQADGLEPEIEAFMWRIVEKIHIKAVGDQSQFLLGI